MKRVINGKTYSKIIGVKKGEFPIFGDDGELQSSGKKPSDIPEGLPSGGTQGQVLTKGASAPEWADVPKELPAIGSGDAGKVLKVNAGETGVEWDTPAGVTLYRHSVFISHNNGTGYASFNFVSKSNTPISSISALNGWLTDNGYDSYTEMFGASGSFMSSALVCNVYGVYAENTSVSLRGMKVTSDALAFDGLLISTSYGTVVDTVSAI